MTKEEIEDILTDLEVQTEPGGAGWIATKDIDKTADVFVEAIDKSYNQAIDDAIKAVNDWWKSDSPNVNDLRKSIEALKNKP